MLKFSQLLCLSVCKMCVLEEVYSIHAADGTITEVITLLHAVF